MEDKLVKPKRREQCGDCFYNGNCITYLRKCPYLNGYYQNKEK